jgi:hypothetical protein
MHVVNEEVGLEDDEEKHDNSKHVHKKCCTSGNNSEQQRNASQIIQTSEGAETKSHHSQQKVLGVRVVTSSGAIEGFREGLCKGLARVRDIKFYNSII